MAEIWERQKKETSRSYEKFAIFRDMGVSRTLRKVQEKYGLRALRSVEILSSKYHWVERAKAYDAYIDSQIRLQNEQDIIDMRKRHIQQALMMQKSVIERIQNTNPKELTLSECTRMFDISVKVERLSRGCEDNVTKVDVANSVNIESETVSAKMNRLNKLSLEELEEYKVLCEKMNSE